MFGIIQKVAIKRGMGRNITEYIYFTGVPNNNLQASISATVGLSRDSELVKKATVLIIKHQNENHKSPSTDHADGHVGLGKRNLPLVLVFLLTFLVVVNLVLAHVYSPTTPFIPTVPGREKVLRWHFDLY